MVDIFAFPNINAIPLFPEFLWKVLEDREMSFQELAEKLNVSLEQVHSYNLGKEMPSPEILKKMSGIFGIRYRIMRLAAGYSLFGMEPLCRDFADFYDEKSLREDGILQLRQRPYSDFYLPDGTEVDLDGLLSNAYYQSPDVLCQLIKLLSNN